MEINTSKMLPFYLKNDLFFWILQIRASHWKYFFRENGYKHVCMYALWSGGVGMGGGGADG